MGSTVNTLAYAARGGWIDNYALRCDRNLYE